MATTTTTTEDHFNPRINPEISVLFYDGEREIDLGKVQITPLMTFKLLQTTLSNIIGISPNHITIYLDRNNNVVNTSSNNSQRRRHPVTSKFDFSSLDTARSYLWVVLKRGRRNRRRRKTHLDNENGIAPFVLLRRGLDHNQYMTMISELEMIERQKEFNYLMSLNLNSHVYNELTGGNYNYNYDYDYDYRFGYDNYSDEYYSSCSSNSGPSTERVYCEGCCGDENGGMVPFHWCKNDAVVGTGFRPVVGPIAPPNKTGILR